MPEKTPPTAGFTFIFEDEISMALLNKDVGMIAAYIHSMYGIPAEIACYAGPETSASPPVFHGVRITPVKRNLLNRIPFLRRLVTPLSLYVMKNARSIGCLMQIHPGASRYFNRFIYSLLNPAGKTYLKLDASMLLMEEFEKPSLHASFRNSQLSGFTLLSAETTGVFEKLGKMIPHARVLLLPNGFDSVLGGCPEPLPFEKKENMMVISGRIGNPQKNHGMLLSALKKTRFNGWKVLFLGPIDPDFEGALRDFFLSDPALKESVFIIGHVPSRDALYGYYNRSKVLCSTSLWEGFPLVFAEAAWFGNCIISTPVGAEFDITGGGRYGITVPMNDPDALSRELDGIFSGKRDLKECCEGIMKLARDNFTWETVVKKLYSSLSAPPDRRHDPSKLRI